MKKKSSKYIILALLAVLFAAPGLSALLFYTHPTWLRISTVNKGQLIKSPMLLKELGEKAKWRMIFWSPNTCDKTCLSRLETLAKTRLALGRFLYEVDLWLIIGENASSLDVETQSMLKNEDVHILQLASLEEQLKNTLSSKPQVLIANKENYLILSYKADAKPDDLYQDLKRLLK